MEESGLEPGSTPPAPSALKYMTVPEKIELTSAGTRGGYPSAGGSMMDQSGYRPMKVPDMITLEPTATASPVASSRQEGTTDGASQPPPRRNVARDPVPQVQQEDQLKLSQEPATVKPQGEYNQPIADLDRRVRTLEQQVQRLKDIAVNRAAPVGQAKKGNNFWYVLTFAGWMMIPLIVVYVYRFRR